MSALPIPISLIQEPTKAPPAPAGVLYIALKEACYRSGIPMETLARRCRDEWAGSNLAILERPADGGKPCWHVREDTLPAFARSKSPDALPFDSRAFTQEQRRRADYRKELLDAWMEARGEAFTVGRQSERQVTESFVARCRLSGENACRATLYRWLVDFNAKGRSGLVDARQKSHKLDSDRKWFEDQLEHLFLSRRRSKQLCFDRAVDHALDVGRLVPYGYKQAQRFLQSLNPKMVTFQREGPRAYEAKFGRYIRRSHETIVSCDLWMSDGHKFDVQVMYQGKATRPILVSWMDIASRMIVGHSIEPRSETADAIRLALKRAVEAFGTPKRVYIDNGASFDAEHLQGITKAQRKAGMKPKIDLGIFPRLGAEVTHSRAYNAKAKGEIERFHRTICDRFCCELPGYMGGNPIDKPHTYAAEVKAGKLLDFDEFCQRFNDWLTADYHHREHTGDGMNGKTPAAVFAERMREKRVLTPDKIELELCRRTRVTVGRNGVSIKLHGATLAYEHQMLDSMSGHEVDVILDDDRLDRASIYRLDGSRLCVADVMAAVPVNATQGQLREAMKSRSRDRRAMRQADHVKPRIADDPWERMARKAAELEAASPVAMPDSFKLVRPSDPAIPATEPTDDFDDDYERYADIEPRKAVASW